MGFDKNSNLPIMDPKKRTTKVNIAIAVAVVVFLAICAGVVVWLTGQHPPAAPADVKKTA